MINVLITGGAGTLGTAIAERVHTSKLPWNITVYSRDYDKHLRMKRTYPNIRYVVGDVCDYDNLYRTAVGHHTIIHAAAQKHIPVAESQPIEAARVNIDGSHNVAMAAVEAGVQRVVGISTDKVCEPTSIYGVTKLVMERMFVKYAEEYRGVVDYHLCRYGNVIGSTGSAFGVWAEQERKGQPITVTDPDMTRFWLSPDDAVDLVLWTLDNTYPGVIAVPKAPAMRMGDLVNALYPDSTKAIIGARPGEKKDELLLTEDEFQRVTDCGTYWLLHPEPQPDHVEAMPGGYKSANPIVSLTHDALRAMMS